MVSNAAAPMAREAAAPVGASRASPSRMMIGEDGHVIACFPKWGCIVLEPWGGGFTCALLGLGQFRYLTSCCPTSLRAQVSEAIRFRNLHGRRPPLLCQILHGSDTLPAGTDALKRARWLTPCDSLTAGDIRVDSLGSMAELILSPLKKTFTVQYNCTIPPEGGGSVDLLDYNASPSSPDPVVRVVQEFPVESAPSVWSIPLKLALAYRDTQALSGDANSEPLPPPYLCSDLPGPEPWPEVPSWEVIAPEPGSQQPKLLPSDILRFSSSAAFYGPLPVVTEWKEGITYWILAPPLSSPADTTAPLLPSTRVLIRVDSDGTLLEVDGEFVTWFGGTARSIEDGADGNRRRVFHLTAVRPVQLPCPPTFSLSDVCEHAVRLRDHFDQFRTKPIPDTQIHFGPGTENAFSGDLVSRVRRCGLGTFSAYADGRVSAVFEDRTLLYMDASRSVVTCVTPDARRMQMHITAGARRESMDCHVLAAVQFAESIFDCRESRRRVMAAADVEASRTRRFCALLRGVTESEIIQEQPVAQLVKDVCAQHAQTKREKAKLVQQCIKANARFIGGNRHAPPGATTTTT